MVTGGSSYLGRHLIRSFLSKYEDIRVRDISRSENDIAAMPDNCHSERLEYVIADIRDIDALKYALTGVDTVVHLAAMKHIDFCELYPAEAIATNVVGTMNLLRLFKGHTSIAMSTDKAVEATGCYGTTKLLLERLVLAKAREDDARRHLVVRSGNIFGSSGSVVPKWRHQIKERNEIAATDLEMTRFFIDVNTLADFVIHVMENGAGGKIFIPPQKALKLETLARAVIDLHGDENTRVITTGLRRGEKLHERLRVGGEDTVSGFLSDSSQDADKLETEEIEKLLQDLLIL